MIEQRPPAPEEVYVVKRQLRRQLSDPAYGQSFKISLNNAINSMRGWRATRLPEEGGPPTSPDDDVVRQLICNQLACEIYQGQVICAKTIWETHDDIRARGQIPPDAPRASGELFHLKNKPIVPIIRCDKDPSAKEIATLKNQGYVLLDPFLKLL